MAIILAIIAAASVEAIFHNLIVALIIAGITWGAVKIATGNPTTDKYITVTDMSKGTVQIMPQDKEAQKYLRSKGE